MHLVGHIARLAAHSCRWAMLPEVTVPSAAVDDETTEQWSADMYQADLDREPPALTGEQS